MDEPDGVAGELIDRLLWAVNAPEGRDWLDHGFYLVFAVGGPELAGIEPDSGPPVPGSYGEKVRATRQVVSRDEYLDRIGERLAALVLSGVREDFLVRALRNELTAHMQTYAQTEATKDKRDARREEIEQHARDPEFIAAFRERMAKRDPEDAKLSDQAIAGRLRDMARRVGKPMFREEEERAWASSARWIERSKVVSDEVLEKWADRYAQRVIGSST
ncbi:MAG: hypothetical protein M3082_16485 [Candidatus Dormibacteraeota bacterium]|nr:hypothetical protein [Candidatus Dormibacteraeota bacterium]